MFVKMGRKRGQGGKKSPCKGLWQEGAERCDQRDWFMVKQQRHLEFCEDHGKILGSLF